MFDVDSLEPDVEMAADATRSMLARLAGEGGVLDQIASGDFVFQSDQHRRDVAALLDAATEAIRAARELAGGGDVYSVPATELALKHDAERLPFNRKERYFTGTVLPMLVASDGFAHLDRFLALCGLDEVSIEASRAGGQPDVQFLTEYGFGESLVGKAKGRFQEPPRGKDTPDVVLAGPDWLLAVEAKLYDRPSAQALNKQLAAQRQLLDYWASQLDIPQHRCRHVALLPGPLADSIGPDLTAPVVRWEAVRDAYVIVGPAYWVGVLAAALDLYEDRVSKAWTGGSRSNAQARMTGAEIATAAEDGEVRFGWMGRTGGLDGAALLGDLASGAWQQQTYEIRHEPLPDNPNWFTMTEFLAKIADRTGEQ